MTENTLFEMYFKVGVETEVGWRQVETQLTAPILGPILPLLNFLCLSPSPIHHHFGLSFFFCSFDHLLHLLACPNISATSQQKSDIFGLENIAAASHSRDLLWKLTWLKSSPEAAILVQNSFLFLFPEYFTPEPSRTI